MARVIHVKPSPIKRIRDTSKTMRRIPPEQVAEALGAEPVPTPVPVDGSPIALFALRQYLFEQIQSHGGRPARTGATRRQKVPLSDAEWHRLEEIAGAMHRAGVRATPGQVAGALLHQALEQITDPEAWREFLRTSQR